VDKDVGDRLRELRERRGLKQSDLAAKLGVHVMTVTLWENKKARRKISTKYIQKIVRGREPGYPGPPAQIRASGIPALGSYLGCLTANRTLGQGCRTRGFGRNSSASFAIRSQATRALWLRRQSCRCHKTTTW
jgi:DNA-binding XRE family transcriptional regulator